MRRTRLYILLIALAPLFLAMPQSCNKDNPVIENNIVLGLDTVDYTSTGQFLSIFSSGSWTASCEYANASSWCTISQSSGSGSETISLTYSANPSSFDRSVNIIVRFANENLTVTLVQQRNPEFDLRSDAVQKWMELPGVSLADSTIYVSHYTTISGKVVRNYSMLYDAANKLARWVAYPLTSIYRGRTSRTDAWGWDPKVPTIYQVNLSKSYYSLYGSQGYNYNRGHQLPSADRNCSISVNEDTYFYTNMTAQHGDFNGSIWADLEGKIRTIADANTSSDTLYVVTGPLLTSEGSSEITYMRDPQGKRVTAIPRGYFKMILLYEAKTQSYYSIGFLFEKNEGYGRQTINGQDVVTVKRIEDRTGYQFFSNLPASTRNQIIAQRDLSRWGLTE